MNDQGRRKRRVLGVRLWAINRWLRWTGVRMVVSWPTDEPGGPPAGPITIGFVWWGWRDF